MTTASRIAVGDRITRQAANGHAMDYRVVGFYDNGRAKVTQYDAWHSDECRCHAPESEYEPIPDW